MSINRFRESAPMEWKLPKIPLEALGFALEQRQKRYDTAYELADEIAEQTIKAKTQDRARANELTRGWNQKIDEMVAKYDGDYSRMYKELGSLKRDISRTMAPGGEGGTIEAHYNTWNKWLEEQGKRVGKEITAQQFNVASQYYDKGYTGIGEQDPITGNYNTFNPQAIAKYVDANKILFEALDNIAADEGGSVVSRPDGFYIKTSGGKFEKITEERIARIAERTLLGNDEYMQYMSQAATHLGIDPMGAIQYDIQQRALNAADIYRKDNRWYESDLKGNPIAVKMWEMQQMERINNAPGLTMPGNIENTKLNGMKIDLESQGSFKSSGTGQEPLAGTGLQYNRKSQLENSAEKLVSRVRADMKAKSPVLLSAFDTTVSQVKQSPEYQKASEIDKQKLIRDAWNAKLENVETVSVNDIVISAQQIPDVKRLWESGMAKAAHYRKVNKDGSLGEVQKFEDLVGNSEAKQKELLSAPPIVLTPHSQVSGAKTYFGDDEYIVTNTHLDDFSRTYLKPISELRKPFFDGEAGEIPYVGMPIPSTGKPTAQGSKLRVTFNSDLQRVGEIIGPDGRVIETLSPAYVNDIEGMYTRSASAELPKSSRYSSDYIDYGDTKNRYD